MKALSALSIYLLACSARAFESDDFFDRLDSALTVNAVHDELRVRFSGLIDLEAYHFEQPAPALDFVGGFEAGGKYEFNPVIWGPSYASGVSVSGRLGQFDYAVEMKNSPLASRPESWSVTEVGFDNPAFNARAGFRPNQAW